MGVRAFPKDKTGVLADDVGRAKEYIVSKSYLLYKEERKMIQIAVSEKTQADTERPVLRFRLPYPNEIAGIISIQALNCCAQKMGLSNRHDVAELLKQGDSCADAYYRYSMAEQAAEYLGTLDREITAVYLVDYDATPNEPYFAEEASSSRTGLIVQVEHKSQDLAPLIKSLNSALAQCYADVTGTPQLACLFDVYLIKGQDIKDHVDYDTMLSSLYNRPIPIWARDVAATA